MKEGSRPDAVAVVVLRDPASDVTVSPRDVTLSLSKGAPPGEALVLLLRRAGGAFAGAWTFVMGGVEEGEHGTDAARRELREETGLSLATLYTAGELDAFYDPVRDRIAHVPFFVARVGGGECVLETDVHDEHRWVTFAEAAELLEFASHRRALEEIHRGFVASAPRPWRLIR